MAVGASEAWVLRGAFDLGLTPAEFESTASAAARLVPLLEGIIRQLKFVETKDVLRA